MTTAHRKLPFLAAGIVAIFFLLGFVIFQANAATNDSSINLKKDPSTGYFTLTIKDPDGIQEFSLSPVNGSRYGGGLSGCPGSFVSNNVVFGDPGEFTPVMPAYIVDCNNNTTELEIPPPVDGVARSHTVAKETPPPPPPPPPTQEETDDGIRSAEDIRYPVPELGNSQNEAESRSYCDNVDHAKECLTFARKYNLISEDEIQEASDKFLSVRNGPGGCNSWSSCEDYCSSVDNLNECIAFADETGYYTPEKLAEARKFQELIKSGAEFPGGCKDRNECEVYCGVADNMEECLNFAEKSGFMPQEEIAEARKFMTLMQKGESPGGCNSKEQCENYCAEESNINECVDFSLKAGVMTAEEADMVKKTGGKGPGGCHSKQQCDTYCEENGEECFNWAKDNGLISEADLAKMTDGMKQFRDELDKMPPEAVECIKDAIGEDNFNKMANGEPVFDRGMEGKMKSCFGQVTAQFVQQLKDIPPEAAQCIQDALGEKGFQKLQKLQSGEAVTDDFEMDTDFESLENCYRDLQQSFGGGDGNGTSGGGGGNFDKGGFSGPGGCKTTAECTEFCTANPEECQGFGPPGGSGDTSGGGLGDMDVPPEVESCMGEELMERLKRGDTFARDQLALCFEKIQAYSQTPLPQSSTSEPPQSGTAPSSISSDPYDPANLPALPDSGTYAFKAPTKPKSCVPDSFSLVSWWNGYVAYPGYQSKQTALDIHDGNDGFMPYASYASGKVGQAISFNGLNTYGSGVVAKNPANLNFGTGPFSLEAWFKWESGGQSSVNNIIRKSLTASNYDRINGRYIGYGTGYWLRISQGTKLLEFFTGDTGDDPAKPRGLITTPVSPGIWYHVIATRGGSGTMKLYVDGELKGTKEAPNANTTSESSFTIGAWKNDVEFGAGVSESFMGLIDEVSVYNKALSASEVKTIFNLGDEGKCSRQVAYPSTSAEYKEAYRSQQGEYQFYLLQTQAQKKRDAVPITEFTRPGDCANEKECQTYCAQNNQVSECWQGRYLYWQQQYRINAGCTSGYEDGCKTYCAEHPSDSQCQDYLVRCAEQGYDYPVCQQSAPSTTEPTPVAPPSTTPLNESDIPVTNGPGGCTTRGECIEYCTPRYPSPECEQYPSPAPSPTPSGGTESQPPATNYIGPGGCTTAECTQNYCIENYTDPACATSYNTSGFITPRESNLAAGGVWYRDAEINRSPDPLLAGVIFLLQGLFGGY